MSTPWSRFWRLVGAEALKLRTVRRWMIALAAVVPLAVGFALLVAQGNKAGSGDTEPTVGPHGLAVTDQFHFMYQPLDGDGSVTVHVVSQDTQQPGAGAGIMVKAGVQPGTAYAAVMVTPRGVRMSSDFDTAISGPPASSPQWLRLTRAGATVTGYASPDGTTWQRVGTVTVPQLAPTVQVGLFASSPPQRKLAKALGSTSLSIRSTVSSAVFDHLTVSGTGGGHWSSVDVGAVDLTAKLGPGATSPRGSTREADGVYTLSGSGTFAVDTLPDDPVESALFGLFFGLMVLIPVAVLFMTAEHKRSLLRTTFAASPHRGTVLAAKATVIAATGFVLGVVAAVLCYAVAMPRLRAHGFRPPRFEAVSLQQPDVWRAIIGSGVLFAALAVLGTALGAVMRHSAAAIATTVALVVVPMFVGTPLPLAAARWLMYLTPAGGFAVQRIKAPDPTLAEPWAMIGPWPGIAAVTGYALAAMAVAIRLARTRDA